MADFTAVTRITVRFLPHHSSTQAHQHLNNLYADELPQFERVFTDPATRQEVHTDATLLAVVRDIIINEMIHQFATETADAQPIAQVLVNLALRISITAGPTAVNRRLSKAALTDVMTLACSNVAYHGNICIQILTNGMYFNPDTTVNFLDWNQISATPFAATTALPPVTAPPTATDIAAAVAGALPVPPALPSAADIANAFAVAFPTAAGPGGAVVPPAGPGTIFTFNSTALPNDVATRYDNKKARGLVVGNTVSQPFAGGNRFHIDNNDKLILADGTMFLLQTPNEKGVVRDPVTCKSDDHAGIRQWYESFTDHCHTHGYYVHPLWCFRPDHGGERGFTAGDDPDDDLPRRMSLPLDRMHPVIYRLLQKDSMFPAGSRLIQVVASCFGDGYKALKQVLFNSHPVFYDQPSTLITNYPRQRTLSLLAYYRLFIDYLQLRAFIANSTSTLNDKHELDIFIGNAAHSDYLNRVTRDERRVRTLRHRYEGPQLVETLQRFLQAPDSPALSTRPFARTPALLPARPPSRRFTTSRPPAVAPSAIVPSIPVNHLNLTSEPDSPPGTAPLATTGSEDTMDSLDHMLDEIEVPNNPADMASYYAYRACIYNIQHAPTLAIQQQCIVCNNAHTFDQCPVLSNNNFLRQHYIRYCQLLRRDATSRAATFSDAAAGQTPGTPTRVNFLTTDTPDDMDDDFDPATDFQQGRG